MIKPKEERKEREFLCDFDGFAVFRNDVVEFRKPMTHANEPTQLGRVCSLIKDVKVNWPNEDSRPVLLVAGFDGKYAAIDPDDMLANFGVDYLDGYDGCLSSDELVEFDKWSWLWTKSKEARRG